MFCTASHYLVQSQDIDDLVRLFKEKIIPGTAQQKGYKGIEVITKPNTSENTSEFVVLKFWDSEENSNAWSKNPVKKQLNSGITPLLIGKGTHHFYIVQARTVQ